MSKKMGYLLGMLLTIVICMILAWIFCCNTTQSSDSQNNQRETTINNPPAVATPEVATSMAFNLKGPDGKFAFTSNDNFNFNTSSFSILPPISGEVTDGVNQLKTYFETAGNEDKMIDITGYYDSGEKNTSAFADLGLARSNSVKNYFVDQGIPSSRINTYGELRASIVPDGNVYKGPIEYRIFNQANGDLDATNTALQDIENSLRADPLVLYFNYGEASVTLSEKQRLQIGDISRYLDKKEGATITVEGHTDSQGSLTTNDRLGLERAEFAKAYLANNGIPGSKIKTVSKGERSPIETNDTEEGRNKNRRAVITLN